LRGAFVRLECKNSNFPGFDKRPEGSEGSGIHVQLLRTKSDHRGGIALVMDLMKFDAGRLGKPLRKNVSDHTITGCPVLEFPGMFFGVIKKLLKGFPWRFGMNAYREGA
jgi:hypothetical protein